MLHRNQVGLLRGRTLKHDSDHAQPQLKNAGSLLRMGTKTLMSFIGVAPTATTTSHTNAIGAALVKASKEAKKAASRNFSLPVERPGGRYLTRIQMDRMKKAAAEAAKRAEKDRLLRGRTGLGVIIEMLQTPVGFVQRHKIKFLISIILGSTVVMIVLVLVLRKMRDNLREKKTELKRLRLLIFHRLTMLKERSNHWKEIAREMEIEMADCKALQISRTEAAIGMLFDELLTLSTERYVPEDQDFEKVEDTKKENVPVSRSK
mmetsp:Transcript_9321/g.15046  ORF Transcript_9321/g.15046 Transcript_9321/m.15046 type:complete len:262 (+) Transcript_9321:97-882(+)